MAKNPPKPVNELWKTSETNRTPAEWALRWIWNHEAVSLVLSGMGSMDMVVENVKSADKAITNSLTVEELNLVDKVKEMYNDLIKVNCTGCAYCMPCPFGVDIPSNFSLLNQASMYDDIEGHSFSYNNHMPEKARASSCAECGKCETLCPQNLSIRRHLKEVHEVLKK